jgi:hypothetical protein
VTCAILAQSSAASSVTDNLIPIGTVSGMLVAITLGYLRAMNRTGERADKAAEERAESADRHAREQVAIYKELLEVERARYQTLESQYRDLVTKVVNQAPEVGGSLVAQLQQRLAEAEGVIERLRGERLVYDSVDEAVLDEVNQEGAGDAQGAMS